MPSELPKRAAAVFKWREGMRTTNGATVVRVDAGREDTLLRLHTGCRDMPWWAPAQDSRISFGSPSNLGHMLAQVREAWEMPELCLIAGYGPDGVEWLWDHPYPDAMPEALRGPTYTSEVLGLIAAMEARS